MNLYDIKMIESELMVITKEATAYKTWKERLFSWPWKPWIKIKTIYIKVPDPNIIYLRNENAIVCHPVIANQLRKDMVR